MSTVMDMIARGWFDFIARPDGSLSLRFYLQPAMAIFLAIRAGIGDAREGRQPYLTTLLWRRGSQRQALQSGWRHVRNVFFVSLILDVVYQLITHRSVYPLELLFTATCLAIMPYLLARGPAYRIARYFVDRRTSGAG